MTTGEIIKNLRIKNGYTQTELAGMLGLTLSTMQKYENGAIQNLKLNTLRELCNIFSVPPITLVFPYIPDKNKRKLMKWGVIEYSGLNPKGVDKVIQYIEDMQKIKDYRK